MNKNFKEDLFIDYFWTFRLKDKLSYLSLHVNSPQEGTPQFLKFLKEIASEVKFDIQRFNELLDRYLNTTNKDDLTQLKDIVDTHFDNIQKEIKKIPNDINKARCSLKGIIGSKLFETYSQGYDAIVLLKDEISTDLIEDITDEWKLDLEYILSDKYDPSKIFWPTDLHSWDIDCISMYRFKEIFDIKGFDSTFNEAKRELEERIWEYSPPHKLDEGPFYFWLIDRVPKFLNEYHATTSFLESIQKEQTSEGFWENKNIIKSQNVEDNIIKDTEYEKDTSGTALCSINLIKHSKYDSLRDSGIKGSEWLLKQQNPDGSWSDEIIWNGKVEKKKGLFVTLLALEALIRSEIPNITPQIELGLQCIMSKQNELGWWEDGKFLTSNTQSHFPFMTVLVLELHDLFRSYKGQQLVASDQLKKHLLLENVENYHPKYDPNIYIGCSLSTKEEDLGTISNYSNIKSFLVPYDKKDEVLANFVFEDLDYPPQPVSYFDDDGNYITGETFEKKGITFEIIINERGFEGLDISYYEPTDRLITYLGLQRTDNKWINPYNEDIIIQSEGNCKGWDPHETYISIRRSELVDYLAARKCSLLLLRYSERRLESTLEFSGFPNAFDRRKTDHGFKSWLVYKNDLSDNYIYEGRLWEIFWIDPAPYPRRKDFESSEVTGQGVSFVLNDGERTTYGDDGKDYLKLISFDPRVLKDFLTIPNNKIEFSSLTNLKLKYSDASSLSGCINSKGQFQALFGLINKLDTEKQLRLAAFSESEKAKMAYEYYLNMIEGEWTKSLKFSYTLSKSLNEVNKPWETKFGEKLLLNPKEHDIPVTLLIGPISNDIMELIDLMLEFQKLVIPESKIETIKSKLDYSHLLYNENDYKEMKSIAFTRLFFKENRTDGNIGESYILRVINDLRNCKAHPKDAKEILKEHNIPEDIRKAYFFILSEFCNFLLAFKDLTGKSLGVSINSKEETDPWEKLEIAQKYFSAPSNGTMRQIYNEN